MPRPLDIDQRRLDILRISLHRLEESGPVGLTLRAIAKELGGSITLVTHIYPTRRDLLNGLAQGLIDQYDAELPVLEAGARPRERLWILLKWMLPLTDSIWRQERARILLVSDMDAESAGDFAGRMDARMRELIREHLRELVDGQMLEPQVDLLRVITNGIVLAAVEHHDQWPAERQLTVLRTALRALRLETSEG